MVFGYKPRRNNSNKAVATSAAEVVASVRMRDVVCMAAGLGAAAGDTAGVMASMAVVKLVRFIFSIHAQRVCARVPSRSRLGKAWLEHHA